ncbi:MAG TPA: FxDxF family PEP-CTERM protein [Nitrospiraceae bacterium]|nr:FxDxF family PEP-CTERM protein [Nitrospiraceae bacterium]
MKLKLIVAASALAISLLTMGAGNSYALNQTIDLSSGNASFTASGPSVLNGGQDVLSFINLTTGTYNFDFSMSSQYANISSVLVNGQAAADFGFGVFRFFGLSSVSTTPFYVTVNGTGTSQTMYSGELQVRAVPEAGTYLLLFAGLGMVCLAARYRKIA